MNHTTQKFILVSIVFLTAYLPGHAQFFLNGSATTTNDSCYQLTAAVNSQVGSIWNGDKVSLDESFEVLLDLFVGCEDDQGADGLVFGLQPVSTSIGGSGGDLGFGDVSPALGVEFDTYQNVDYDDPTFDHITIIRDGVLNHTLPGGALAGPVQASATDANIEDCQYHPLRITWDAATQTLDIYLDCELRISYTADLVNDVFNGDPLVFWGFTAATGGLNNLHEVCFSYTSFLNRLVDQTTCPGQPVQLEASGGISYSWSPTTGLSDPTIANPIASPEETTLYTVEITDDCGIPFTDDVLITVDNDQFTVGIDLPPDATTVPPGTELDLNTLVGPDTTANYTYTWSSVLGSTFSDSQSGNPTLSVTAEQTGTEVITVVVTSSDGCVQTATVDILVDGPFYQIPNFFSPNGDQTNDTFGLYTSANVQDYSCKVFNRWGQLVFENSNPNQHWSGEYNDKPAPADVYIYAMSFRVGGREVAEQGQVTLAR